ncbi:GTP-binding protein, partial [Escherichia coli]|uniref:GTP-binding protein n=1 Tax=Escherichia coli TaxID=562 RepID=UPI0039E17E1D
MAEELADDYLIDAIITLVDAKHGDTQLSEHEVAQWQVGFADKIFITKTDLVDGDTLAALQSRLKHINPRAAVQIAAFGGVEVAQ